MIQPDNQLCSLTCFFVFACLNQNINLFILFWIREKEQAKRAKWARIFKTPSWMSSFAHSHVFLIYLLKQVWKYLFINCIWNQKELTELSELNELKCSKTPKQMSTAAHKHFFFVFACSSKHEYTPLLSLHKIKKNWKKFHSNFS